ncbi:MAG: YifB family Mg chelatase-like AAA ATPase [Lachnospiraceae bacterium]|nr:YifB family Mg chelatase-like AAA ATPase [Lachnospiraceae bacterium]
MVGTVCSGGVHGIDAYLVRVECDISEGFPGFDLVGSLSPEVRESRERVITALRNSGIRLPSKKITINLFPANVKKHGTGYDLPVAVSLLLAAGIVALDSVEETLIIGELMLTGEIGGVKGVLPIVKYAKDMGIKRCIVPSVNEREAVVVDGIMVIPVSSLGELIGYLSGSIDKNNCDTVIDKSSHTSASYEKYEYDFKDVSGQAIAKRGLEIGAAGLHNILMVGPPGTGKTLLAKCIPGILPPMNKDEILEVSSIYSVAGKLPPDGSLINNRPVVEAHHTISEVALAGGGTYPRPGLISLAHRGVLFLDEMPEFNKSVLEVLRQPIEDKVINLSKNGYSARYPANFMLVGALNPCPCGMYPDMKKCTCTESMRRRYMGKISKPLLDRMDLCLQVLRPNSSEMLNETEEESSEDIRKRVLMARDIQFERYKGSEILFNSQMGIKEIEKYCKLGESEKLLMEKAISKYDLSARSYHRILRSARTIADLDSCESIGTKHLTEALFYKSDYLC